MIQLRFGDFRAGNYSAGNQVHQLYLVRNPEEVLYIGISRAGIWWRWFEPFIGHFGQHSEISERIRFYSPASEEWTIELWTLEDCLEFLRPERTRYFKSSGRAKKRLAHFTLEDCEAIMIKKFQPLDNAVHNIGREDISSYGKWRLDEINRLMDSIRE